MNLNARTRGTCMKHLIRTIASAAVLASGLTSGLAGGIAHAAPIGFLETLHKNTTLINTVPSNGDQNPYALVVAPVSAGTLRQGDVLVGNFNNAANLQGTGSTIVNYHPDTKEMSVFATVPRDLKECPGGIGLSTAMTMLKSGWVIVGSTPSNDGTTNTKGAGCLIVLDSQGKVASTIASPDINDPWGNMAVVDNGDHATLFVSNAGFGVGGANGNPPVFKQADPAPRPRYPPRQAAGGEAGNRDRQRLRRAGRQGRVPGWTDGAGVIGGSEAVVRVRCYR
jgi:hypothetical protein